MRLSDATKTEGLYLFEKVSWFISEAPLSALDIVGGPFFPFYTYFFFVCFVFCFFVFLFLLLFVFLFIVTVIVINIKERFGNTKTSKKITRMKSNDLSLSS